METALVSIWTSEASDELKERSAGMEPLLRPSHRASNPAPKLSARAAMECASVAVRLESCDVEETKAVKCDVSDADRPCAARSSAHWWGGEAGCDGKGDWTNSHAGEAGDTSAFSACCLK